MTGMDNWLKAIYIFVFAILGTVTGAVLVGAVSDGDVLGIVIGVVLACVFFLCAGTIFAFRRS